MSKLSLKERVMQFKNEGVPFMQGRVKADIKDLKDKLVTLRDFSFIKNEHGEEYVVFIVDEEEEKFYFGGLVMTSNLKDLKDEGFYEEIKTEGLPLAIHERKNKRGNRSYLYPEYYPNDGNPFEVQ